MNELDQRYYLAVLQVYNDSQIRNHSNYNDVRDYINEVMYSFSRKAPKDSYLVIKHHPMDRGHRLYRPLIKRLSKEYGLDERSHLCARSPDAGIITPCKSGSDD